MASRRRARSKKASSKKEEKDPDFAPDFSQLEKFGEDDDFYRKWSGPVLLGGFLPAIFALIIIFSGQIVINSFKGSCGYPLDSFVGAEVAVSYLYLLVFSWVFMGEDMFLRIPALGVNRQILFPFKSLKWIMGAYLIVGIVSFIVAIVGAALMSLAIFCKDTAPELYQYSLFLVSLNWIGIFVVVVYVVKLSYGGNIAQFIQEKTRQETIAEVESRLFQRKFAEFDPENTKQVKREDALKVLQNLGVFIPEEELEQLINTLDPGATGFVQYDAFFDWFLSLSKEADERDNGPGKRRGTDGPGDEDFYSDDDS